MKVYYSHCRAIYNTPQEKRDLALLHSLGFNDILNPNTVEHSEACMKKPGMEMAYFENLVRGCDALAFRSLPDGSIPAGVGKEILVAREGDKPIFELPNFSMRQWLDVAKTRAYLHEVGQR